MRVALVTPALAEATGGNRTTVQRWLEHVEGVQVHALGPDEAGRRLDPAPDVVHGYHAIHGGEPALELARTHNVPLVVSIGGTDLYELVTGGPRGARAETVLREAQLVTGAFDGFGAILESHLGAIRYATVLRGITLPETVPPHAPAERLRVLLAAGLRRVKEPLLAIDLAQRLIAQGTPIRLRILGPPREQDYADRVLERAEELSWFVSVGEISPEEMSRAYAETDIVWNTSLHEGGCNALLEAVAHGCAILARNVTGNRELLAEPGATGTLFDPDDFASFEVFHRVHARESGEQRVDRMRRGREWLARKHDPRQEATALVRAWRAALA